MCYDDCKIGFQASKNMTVWHGDIPDHLLDCFSPSFDIPAPDPQQQAKKLAIVCHTCGQAGHKALYCHLNPNQPVQAHILSGVRRNLHVKQESCFLLSLLLLLFLFFVF